MSLLLTLKRFYTFSWYFIAAFEESCWLGLPAEIKVQTNKKYETCKDRCKLCHTSQADQTPTWKESCILFKYYAKCRLWANIYKIYCCIRITSLQEKTIMEISSVAITGTPDLRYLDLYLINIFTKSRKTERCTYVC